MIFALSALHSVEDVRNTVRRALHHLSPGGVLLLYDYAEGDYRERRRLDEGYHVQETEFGRCLHRRGEETCALFFDGRFLEFLRTEGAAEVLVHRQE